jgi:HAD superfamily hydrolase (TIGR01484 family)
MKSLSSGASQLKKISLIASDMDGTMTSQGRFSRELFEAFSLLRNSGVRIVLITGRSAGWVNGLASLLPIDGAIAENGGVFFSTSEESGGEELISLGCTRSQHRAKLQSAFQILQKEFPHIQEAPDNAFRVTDWTYSVHNLSEADLARMGVICNEQGWDFTFSNVQCHITPRGQQKSEGLLRVIRSNPPLSAPLDQILTIGDSPNDESMFNSKLFPNSVGVANIKKYENHLRHKPAFLTTSEEAAGFLEMAKFVASLKSSDTQKA